MLRLPGPPSPDTSNQTPLKPSFLPLLLAIALGLFITPVLADTRDFESQLHEIQDEWAEAFYHMPESQQIPRFKSQLSRVRALQHLQPQRAEPLIVEAVILCTYAAADWGLKSLSRLNDARNLLIESIDKDPKAMDASAYITLGNLYYRLPGWPISYGDAKQALVYLEAALRMYPNALDSNYFLGDYWLHEKAYAKALVYLEKADKAPVRPTQRLSDEKIKEELRASLAAARKGEATHSDFFSSLLPSLTDETSH